MRFCQAMLVPTSRKSQHEMAELTVSSECKRPSFHRTTEEACGLRTVMTPTVQVRGASALPAPKSKLYFRRFSPHVYVRKYIDKVLPFSFESLSLCLPAVLSSPVSFYSLGIEIAFSWYISAPCRLPSVSNYFASRFISIRKFEYAFSVLLPCGDQNSNTC